MTQVNSEIPFNANNQDEKMSEGQMGESNKNFTPPTPLNNRGENFGYIYSCKRSFAKPSRANFCTAFMPDSEQIEAIGTKFLCRNSVSVEEI